MLIALIYMNFLNPILAAASDEFTEAITKASLSALQSLAICAVFVFFTISPDTKQDFGT